MSNKLLIGWSEIDTTPEGKVDLSGQYYHRPSEGIHSRLSATALAIESENGEQAVMVSIDLVGFKSDFLEELRSMIKPDLPDLDTTKIMMNVTHTHSAPGVDLISGIGWLTEVSGLMPILEYRKFLLGKLRTLVIEAWKSRNPGGIANAFSFARVGHCRRAVYSNGTAEMYGDTGREDFIGMEGGEDSGVDLLVTFNENKTPTGVVLNVACPSQIMEATYKISSDFMGETRRLLKEKFGKNFRTLCQISAAGCQAPRDLARNYKTEPDFWHEDGVAEIGRRLLTAVEDAIPVSSEIDFSPVMKHEVKKLTLPKRRASYDDFIKASNELKRLEKIMPEDEAYKQFCAEVSRNEKVSGLHGPYDSKLHHFVLIQNNKAVMARYNEQDKKPCFEMEMHVIRIGNVAFASNPFELYLDFGHQIKARSQAKQTFIIQLAAGCCGYLPSARAEQLGGYGGLIINGVVGSDGGKMLVDETIMEIKKLWK
jgi:hypothetical protein